MVRAPAESNGKPDVALPAEGQRWTLKGVAQRELDEARSADGAGDFAERTVRSTDGLHVGHSRVCEIGMVPKIEKVRGEAQGLALREFEIFDEGEVPVLLERTAVDIAAEVSEGGGAVI